MSHFVKKVPTTEEERAAIEAELAKKLRILTALLEKIQKKIDSQELDDEFLALTAQVLRKSPNIQTLFNIRRDALLKMMEKKEEESDEEWKARVGQLCNVELSLCVEALKKDCKSYTAWFHRFWAFERHPNRDVSAEIKNCDLALTVDQRNFHAWDHLRSVARLAQLGSQEAVDFSTKRLTHDVSNYSAYHYRATELPNVRPDTVHGMKINIEALKEEIALVNGCGATEPKDQSPWRYALWLLDQATTDHRPTEAVLLSATTKCLVFSRPVGRQDILNYVELDKDALANMVCSSGSHKFVVDDHWQFQEEVDQVVVLSTGEAIKKGDRYANRSVLEDIYAPASLKTTEAETPFRDFIASCDEILEVEECLWPLYFKTECLERLGESLNHYEEMIKNYQQMAEWDPKRKMVYRYKASVLTIRKALLVDKHVAEPEKTQLAAILDGRGDLDLHGRELTDASALKPLSGLITHLDLRRTGMDIGQIQWMSALEHVDFGQNPIEKIPSGLQLPYLTFLSLANTKVRSIDDVKPVNQLKKLERLLVCETELAESHTKELYDFVGSLRGEGETAIRLITHWL